MVSVAGIVGLLVIVGVNSVVTALLTRFFRVRLQTNWGTVVFVLLIIPVVLVVLTQIMSGAGLGFDLGSAGTVIGVTIGLPLALGVAFDYFWMPAPEEVDLPERYEA